MNLLTYIFGSGTARFPFIGRTPSTRRIAAVLSSSIKLALLAAAICLLGLPRDAEAATLRKGQMQESPAAAPISLQLRSIPEPQTWLTAFSGLGTLLALQRFRRSRNSRRS